MRVRTAILGDEASDMIHLFSAMKKEGTLDNLLVTGVAGLVKPFELSEARLAGGIDYWIVVIVSVVFALTAILGRRKIGRRAGTALVCSYIAYLIYLFSTISPQPIPVPGGPSG